MHHNNSIRVAQQKRCTLQLLLLWSLRTWRSIRCAGQPELPGNAGAVATSFVQKETKKPTKTSTPSSQEARRTTTTAAASTPGIINYRFLTIETNLETLYYILRCFFTTSVKLFLMSKCFYLFTNFCLWLCFSEKGKRHSRNLVEPHFENENMFLEKWKSNWSFFF